MKSFKVVVLFQFKKGMEEYYDREEEVVVLGNSVEDVERKIGVKNGETAPKWTFSLPFFSRRDFHLPVICIKELEEIPLVDSEEDFKKEILKKYPNRKKKRKKRR